MGTNPAVFGAQREHNDRTAVVFPDKAPEVISGRRQRTLSRYELPLRTVALRQVSQPCS